MNTKTDKNREAFKNTIDYFISSLIRNLTPNQLFYAC